jgi:DNA-binding phage protein
MCVDLANRYNELDEEPAAIIFTTLAAVFAEGSQNHFAGVCGEFSRFRLMMMMAQEMGVDPKELLKELNGQNPSE